MRKVEFSLPSIAGKATSLFHPHQDSPMFNRPLDSASPHHRLSRMLYAISLIFLILISIPVVALKAMTYSFIEDNRRKGFMFETTEQDGNQGIAVIMAALPRMLHHAPAKLALVAAVISIFFGAAHLGFVAVDWKLGKRTQSYAFRRNIMFLHITNSILVLFALVSIYVTHKSTSHFRDGYVNLRASRMNDNSTDNFFTYNIGTFDLETWSCELKDVRGAAMVEEDYGKQCNIEVAGRAIMIPFVILAWLVAGIGIWGLVGGGKRGPDGERIKTEDVGVEMGKMNATDED
ncbi:Nn.00g061960.m01.CDS01 [Neocucurbitaria sp. VM-36]